MGGALGLAILASLADGRIAGNIASGSDHRTALAGGYDAAFLVGAVFAALAAALGLLLRESARPVTEPA
jgi:hypothetical protein